MPYLLISLLFLCACATTQPNGLDRQSRCFPIGSKTFPQNLCFLTVDNRFEYNKRNLFFLVDQSKVEQIPALGGGFETIDLMISPSRHYAAVIEDSGEGHGIFFVTALDRVRKQLGVRRCPGIEAYPHGFFNLGWKEDALYFKTATDLFSTAEGEIDDQSHLPVHHYRLLPGQDCRLEALN